MTRNSDPQAEAETTDPAVREPTEEEAERAAAQFRASWQTQQHVPTPPVTVDAAEPEAAPAPAWTDIAAHPILAIAPTEGAAARPEAPSAAPLLGRTMVGVPPPAETSTRAPEPAAPPPPAAHFNRTVVGLALPAPVIGQEAGSPLARAAAAGEAVPGASGRPASAIQHATQRLGSAPPGAGSFPAAADAHYVPEPQPNRISVRPNVISAWDIPAANGRSRRTPSPALIVLVVASVALLILVATRFLGSDPDPTTEEGQPSRTEAVLAEDEAADSTRRTPTRRVQAAKPGSSAE